MNTTITAPTFAMPRKSSFVQTAGKLTISVGQTAGFHTLTANARTFKDGEGNVGWYFTAKISGTAGESLFIVVNGTPVEVKWDKFGSGSWGWGLNGSDRLQTEIVTEQGTAIPVSIRGNCTVVHSKGHESITAGTPVSIQVGITIEVPGSKKWAA